MMMFQNISKRQLTPSSCSGDSNCGLLVCHHFHSAVLQRHLGALRLTIFLMFKEFMRKAFSTQNLNGIQMHLFWCLLFKCAIESRIVSLLFFSPQCSL